MIQKYDYKPEPEFHGEGPHYIGFELEVSDNYNRHAYEAEAFIEEELSDYVYLKEDFSITGDGFEIVSHPATFKWYKNNQWLIDDVTSISKYGMVSHDAPSNSCGLHFHISREPLTNKQLYNMLLLVYTNKYFFRRLAQRGANGYASWTLYRAYQRTVNDRESIEAALNRKIERLHNTSRYDVINTSNSKTIEFRMFKGTLHKSSFWKSLETVDAVREFAASEEFEAVKGGDISEYLPAFRSFISNEDNGELYANLNNFIEVKGL